MKGISGRRKRIRRWLVPLLLLGVVLGLSGCQTLSFYAQAIKGQYQLLAHQQTVSKLLADTNTPAKLRDRLVVLEHLRAFAGKSLKLPVDGHYQKYVDVHRAYVVWNVEATPAFSMEPKTWWYPVVGKLQYRGYFSRAGATNYAHYLRHKGYDAYAGGVEAYSTLGWFKDPLLNTFVFNPDDDLAETIFHELAHQRVFAHSDTDFNEAFATTVGEEGTRRWLKSKGDTAGYDEYRLHLSRHKEFVDLVMATRARLEALYGDTRDADGKLKATNSKRDVPREALRSGKMEIIDDFRRRLAKLKADWGGDRSYDSWFEGHISNAQLNSIAAYYDLVPGFLQLLELNGGDLEKFYVAADRLSQMSKKDRHQWLRTLSAIPQTGGSTTNRPVLLTF
jgi:predicted aminopeptidase